MCRRDQRDAGKREDEAKERDRAHITQRLLNHGNNLVLYPTSTVKTFQCFMGKWGVCCDLLGTDHSATLRLTWRGGHRWS